MEEILGLLKVAPGPGNLELRRFACGAPKADEVCVRVVMAGLCGTDLHIADGEWAVNTPVVIGHEFTGIVERVGQAVPSTWVGRRVVSEVWYATDGTCHVCISGRRNVCASRRSLGSHAHGAFASKVNVPVMNLHLVPEELEDLDAALMEPLACVVNAFSGMRSLQSGDRILVTGPGTMGILASQLAMSMGADVTLVGTNDDRGRLDIAKELGIDAVTNEEALGLDMAEEYDIVIECSGARDAAVLCLSGAKRRGAYVQIGLFGHDVEIPMDMVCTKELSITSGYGATRSSFTRALRLAASGRVRCRPLVSKVFALSAWQEAFAETRRGDAIKILLDPRE